MAGNSDVGDLIGLVLQSKIAMLVVMSLTPATLQVPLVTDAHGTIRMSRSRVTLESVVTSFRSGSTAEEIVQQFSTLALADVYQVIAYYLSHATEVDAYLGQRRTEAASIRSAAEGRFDPSGLRARLVARRPATAG